ncbi:468_t:CDS:1, partial [Paraglomus brasilianum]
MSTTSTNLTYLGKVPTNMRFIYTLNLPNGLIEDSLTNEDAYPHGHDEKGGAMHNIGTLLLNE